MGDAERMSLRKGEGQPEEGKRVLPSAGGGFGSAKVACLAEKDGLPDPREIGLLDAEGGVKEAELVAALAEQLHGTPPRH